MHYGTKTHSLLCNAIRMEPAVIEKTEYIRISLAHLTDTSTYRRLSPLEARMYAGQFRQTILQCVKVSLISRLVEVSTVLQTCCFTRLSFRREVKQGSAF
jgi:hypothetical protein